MPAKIFYQKWQFTNRSKDFRPKGGHNTLKHLPMFRLLPQILPILLTLTPNPIRGGPARRPPPRAPAPRPALPPSWRASWDPRGLQIIFYRLFIELYSLNSNSSRPRNFWRRMHALVRLLQIWCPKFAKNRRLYFCRL